MTATIKRLRVTRKGVRLAVPVRVLSVTSSSARVVRLCGIQEIFGAPLEWLEDLPAQEVVRWKDLKGIWTPKDLQL